MTDAENEDLFESAWDAGNRAAWISMLQRCLIELGHEAPTESRAVLQLEQARIAARQLCAELGCDDYPDDLHLADVIEKRIGRYVPRP